MMRTFHLMFALILAAALVACDQEPPADMTATPPNPPEPDIPIVEQPAPPPGEPAPSDDADVQRDRPPARLPDTIADAVSDVYQRARIESFTSHAFDDGSTIYDVTFQLPDRSRWTLRLDQEGETIGNARCIERP